MARSKTWGFPRWGGYASETQPESVRLCDHPDCGKPGNHPAPKARDSKEKYWFCQDHAAQYNRSWNYFAGLSYEELRAQADEADRESRYFRQSGIWEQSESGSTRSPEERKALRVLGLEEDASEDDVKSRYRSLAKKFHPDANPGDAAAAQKFTAIHQAYDTLRRATAKRPA